MVRVPDDEATEAEDPLPEGTATVRVGRHEVSARVSPDLAWVSEYFGDDRGPEEYPRKVVFEVGDELPLPLARTCWSAFSDSLEALDSDGRVISKATNGPPSVTWGPGTQ